MEEEEEVPDVADLQDEDVDDEQGAGAGEVQNKWNIISITCPITCMKKMREKSLL